MSISNFVLKIGKYILILTEIPLSLFLLYDSLMANALIAADPITGRERGCYTIIELMVGAKHEGEYRLIELLFGIFLIPLTLYFLSWYGKRRKLR